MNAILKADVNNYTISVKNSFALTNCQNKAASNC